MIGGDLSDLMLILGVILAILCRVFLLLFPYLRDNERYGGDFCLKFRFDH